MTQTSLKLIDLYDLYEFNLLNDISVEILVGKIVKIKQESLITRYKEKLDKDYFTCLNEKYVK